MNCFLSYVIKTLLLSGPGQTGGTIMGVDIRHKDQSVWHKEPKSQDIHPWLLVKLFKFLARQTNSTSNQVVLKVIYELH